MMSDIGLSIRQNQICKTDSVGRNQICTDLLSLVGGKPICSKRLFSAEFSARNTDLTQSPVLGRIQCEDSRSAAIRECRTEFGRYRLFCCNSRMSHRIRSVSLVLRFGVFDPEIQNACSRPNSVRRQPICSKRLFSPEISAISLVLSQFANVAPNSVGIACSAAIRCLLTQIRRQSPVAFWRFA